MRTFWVVVTALTAVAGAQPKSDPMVDADVPGPALELGTTKVTPPPIPSFDLPPANADNLAPRALRIAGKPFLGREVTVKGTVTFAYNCLADVRKPGMTEKAAKDLIDADPTLCERAKFYVGDTKTTRRESSLWVVDVPRPYNKLEVQRIKKADRTDPLKCEPGDTKICPPYKEGDQVEVTGAFALSSPHSERNSDGLLIYKGMHNVTARWKSPGWTVAPSWAPPKPPPSSTPPNPTAIPKPRLIEKIRKSVLDDAKRLGSEGDSAYGQRQWDVAIDRYAKATARWKGHHAAWYGLASAHAAKRDWASAVDAASSATVAHPTNARYRLMHGRALYEKAIQQAKQDQARRENKPVDQVDVDHTTINFEKALVELQTAIAIESRLWRAHYLIGSIRRAGGRAKDAGMAFTRSLELGAGDVAPYIALAELYRAWDYPAAAIAVAEQGATALVETTWQSEMWFEVGMSHDDQRHDDKAIAAFDKSLALNAANHKVKFARGQAYYRKGTYDKAKADLEEFSKVGAPHHEFFKQQASRMLMEIAAKQAANPRR